MPCKLRLKVGGEHTKHIPIQVEELREIYLSSSSNFNSQIFLPAEIDYMC